MSISSVPNTLLISAGFALVCGGYYTVGIIEPNLIRSLEKAENGTLANGYIRLYIATLFYAESWLVYSVSVALGLASAILWVALGDYMAKGVDDKVANRNFAIFDAIYQVGGVAGSAYVFFALRNVATLSSETKNILLGSLIGLSACGTALLCMLKSQHQRVLLQQTEAVNSEAEVLAPPNRAMLLIALDTLKRSLNLLRTRITWLFAILFIYSGLQDAFGATTYATCVGNLALAQLGGDVSGNAYAALSGVCCYAGRMLNGILLTVLFSCKFPRDHVVLTGLLLHIIVFFGAFLLLPSDSSFTSNATETVAAHKLDSAWWQPAIATRLTLLLIGSALLGFGHGCFLTPKNALITRLFNDDPTPIFAFDNVLQALASAICLLYGDYFVLSVQLLILLVFALLSLFVFCKLEWHYAVWQPLRDRKPRTDVNADDYGLDLLELDSQAS